MDLPMDVWGRISQHMELADWARACGTSTASYALWRRLVAAEVCSEFWKDKRVKMTQLRLKRWPFCHSLYLNLQRLHGKLTQAEIAEIERAGGTLPQLRCLHIIGRPHLPVKKTSVEGMLMSILAKHASVLTLHVRAIKMSLDFSGLQHLVLDFGATTFKGGKEDDWGPSLSTSSLEALRTLYVQSSNNTVKQPIDLTKCVHLEHFAVQNTHLKNNLALPEGCRLHVLATGSKAMDIGSGVTDLVGGVTIHMSLSRYLSLLPQKLGPWKVCWEVPTFCNLKQLQLVVNKRDFRSERLHGLRLEARVWQSVMPDLEVLEINAPCNLSVYIGQEIRLKSLTLIAAGTLDINIAIWYQLAASNTTVKQLYLQSSCDFWPFFVEPPRNVKYFREGGHCWTARMPASFQPNNECCCKACPKCLARAGVPILCDKHGQETASKGI